MKHCSICGEGKSSSLFFYHEKSKDKKQSHCKSCHYVIARKTYQKYLERYRKVQREKRREWRKSYPEKEKELRKRMYKLHGSKYLATAKARRRERRELVIGKYGGKCVCCGEKQFEFLCLDHVNGGGAKHRKEVPVSRMPEWVMKNNYPKTIQVLCYNCNCSKGFYGKCPHKNTVKD